MYCPQRRRDLNPAIEGTTTSCGSKIQRYAFLFHDLWLDDVELAGCWPWVRSHPGAV